MIGVSCALVTLALMTIPCAGAEAVEGSLAIESPAELQGPGLRINWIDDSYLAVYDVANKSSVSLRINASNHRLQLLHYEQDYVHPPGAEDGFVAVDQTARLSEEALQPGPLRLALRTPMENFSVIVRFRSPGSVTVRDEALLQRPVDGGLLLAPTGRNVSQFQPTYDRYNWTPNFVSLPLEGLFHHVEAGGAQLHLRGSFEVWMGHATLEETGASRSREVRLDTTVRFGFPGIALGSENYATYNGTMLRGAFEGEMELDANAPLVRVFNPRPTIRNIQVLSAPLAVGQLASETTSASFSGEDHLDLFGNFGIELQPVEPHRSEQAPDSRIRLSLRGQVDGFQINRAGRMPFSEVSAARLATGLGILAAVALCIVGLKQLLAHLVVVPGPARIDRSRILESEPRRKIMDMLASDMPYSKVTHFCRIAADRLGISKLAVYYHLRHLHTAGLLDIVKRSKGASTFVAPNHGYESDWDVKVALILASAPLGRVVARTLTDLAGARQHEVIRVAQGRAMRDPAVGRAVSRVSVFKWIQRFEEFEVEAGGPALGKRGELVRTRAIVLVEKKMQGRSVVLEPSPTLRAVVQRLQAQTGPPDSGPPKEFADPTVVMAGPSPVLSPSLATR